MKPRSLLTLLAICVVLAAGCTVFAGKSEYAAYRTVRTAPDDTTRLLAEQAYISEHPTGLWATEVQAHRVEVEPAVWEAGKATREGLEFYLAAFPDGPHVAQARPRLAALTTVRGRREIEEEQRRAVEAQRRAAQEEQRRTWTTRAVSYWGRTLLGLQGWGSPIPQVAQQNPSFSRGFGENPRPRCTADQCMKFYRNIYAIPVPGATRIDRSIELVLRLAMPGGNVDRVELLLPNKGFSRWYEMENRTIVTDEDPTQRQQAIDWVLERLAPVLGEAGTAQPLDGVTLPVIAPLPFTSTGESTGTGTPGSGGADAADEPEQPAAPNEPPPVAITPEDALEGTSEVPDGGAPAAAPDAGGASVDDLLNQMGGNTTPNPQVVAPIIAPPPVAAVEAPVAPRAVRIFTTDTLRFVIFAAADDDYGTAYDGLFVERNRPAPVAPVVTPPVRGRGRARPPAPAAPRP
jgi:hypothetical protein